ncbi:MAG: PEGA domain-containing protein [Pseudomonadota bacterium]
MMKRFLNVLTIATVLAFFAASSLAAPPPKKGKEKKEAKEKKDKKGNKDKVDKGKKDKKDKKEAKADKEKKEKKGKKGKAEKAEDPKDAAKRFFTEGKEAFDKGDFQAALEKYMIANDTLPNAFVYLKIADCYEKIGNIIETVAWLEKYLGEKPEASNAAELKARIKKLNATAGTVAAASTPEGAKILLDGEDTGKVTPAEIEAGPGQHTLMFELDGYVADSRTFELMPGASQDIAVDLAKAEAEELISEDYPDEEVVEEEAVPMEEPKKEGKVHAGVWATAAIAGAGIISATVFGILALNKEADFEDAKEQGPDEDETAADWTNRLDDIKSTGSTYAIVCDVSWGVGAAAALAGIITYYVTQPKKKKEKESAVSNITIAPMINEGGSGASLGFNF